VISRNDLGFGHVGCSQRLPHVREVSRGRVVEEQIVFRLVNEFGDVTGQWCIRDVRLATPSVA
jgi:hypothetical protein